MLTNQEWTDLIADARGTLKNKYNSANLPAMYESTSAIVIKRHERDAQCNGPINCTANERTGGAATISHMVPSTENRSNEL